MHFYLLKSHSISEDSNERQKPRTTESLNDRILNDRIP